MKLAIFVCVALLAVLIQAEDDMAPAVLPDDSRIYNGIPAAPRQFPHMANIETFNASGSLRWRCAGALVTRSAVLTCAWPCVYNASKWTVRLGSIYRTEDDPNAWTVESVTAMSHPKYNNKNLDNNIAIIQLPWLAPVNDFIQPAHLPRSPADSSYVGYRAIVAGWGWTHYGSGPSDVLRWADVLVIHSEFCKQLRPFLAATDRQLCTSSDNRTVSEHERGAPLVLHTKGGYTVIGLYYTVSDWYATIPHPAFYTRVSSYIDWIKLYTESD